MICDNTLGVVNQMQLTQKLGLSMRIDDPLKFDNVTTRGYGTHELDGALGGVGSHHKVCCFHTRSSQVTSKLKHFLWC